VLCEPCKLAQVSIMPSKKLLGMSHSWT